MAPSVGNGSPPSAAGPTIGEKRSETPVPHEIARGQAQEPARLPVGEQHGAIAVEDEDGV
jgi:hypothetical protein